MAPGATEETIQSTINQDRTTGRGDTSGKPFPPFNTKTKAPQKIREKLSVDMVIGLTWYQSKVIEFNFWLVSLVYSFCLCKTPFLI